MPSAIGSGCIEPSAGGAGMPSASGGRIGIWPMLKFGTLVFSPVICTGGIGIEGGAMSPGPCGAIPPSNMPGGMPPPPRPPRSLVSQSKSPIVIP
jgi:hypothetical protein